jgi:hypothetical protein
VREQFLRCPALLGVPDDAAVEDEIIKLAGDGLGVVGILPRVLNELNHLISIYCNISPRRPSRKHLKHTAPDTPNVNRVRVPLPRRDLRSQPKWRPFVALTVLIPKKLGLFNSLCQLLRCSKITYFNNRICSGEYISTFKVSMNDLLTVNV